MGSPEFSFRTREESLRRFSREIFDLLVIGGGITGAAVARDASSRGLKVALIEKNDFASGTSSRSSKLIHGGLRYLENFEFHLVFEALSERALLLKTAPHMVRPLKFFLPVYSTDPHGRGALSAGLWLYDLLALFRTPGFHRSLSRKRILSEIPFLKSEGLKGGFQYYDASMWDDVMAIEVLRLARDQGAAVANYVEAARPIWDRDRIAGFRAVDRAEIGFRGGIPEERPEERGEIEIRAQRVVVCAGPWTDLVGGKLSPSWFPWLKPSKGVHLIFDLKKIPVPGALVMSHPEDGRIAFVIPRPDFGAGVAIVGTTDGPTPDVPEMARIEPADVRYLMDLLTRYFPDLKLSTSDILSAYIGVRPLMGDGGAVKTNSGDFSGSLASSGTLQKVSREHHIEQGPGGTTVVAGGKYTTHRKMAEEIVDFALEHWIRDAEQGKLPAPPAGLRRPRTRGPMNPLATTQAISDCRARFEEAGLHLPAELLGRYGAEAAGIWELAQKHPGRMKDPEGFPMLAARLRHAIRREMTMRLEDFYLRRAPLYSSRADHGLPWAEELSRVWAEERGLGADAAAGELARLRAEVERRSEWRAGM